ncbi:MAG: hypothetical protein ACJAYU_002100 [Bradymonadia bacterium]|jgi:hypothetical protein
MIRFWAPALAVFLFWSNPALAKDDLAPTPEQLHELVADEELAAYAAEHLEIVDGTVRVTIVNSAGVALNQHLYGV